MLLKAGRWTAEYTRHRDSPVSHAFTQKDDHSCGFIAALTVCEWLRPCIPPAQVLKAVRPTRAAGVGRRGMLRAFEELGIPAEFRKGLRIQDLRESLVVLSVWPDGWASDHWTVCVKVEAKHITLANYGRLLIPQFKREWYDPGEGIVVK
jgi:hypothetical protein